MAGRLEGKVALITGACSGIGLGTLELFVAEGARVVAADLQDEKGAILEKRFPDTVRYAHCDVTNADQHAAAFLLAREAFGGLDVLFNNAGYAGMPGGAETMTIAGWDEIFAVLVRAPAHGMHLALPLLRGRGGGPPGLGRRRSQPLRRDHGRHSRTGRRDRPRQGGLNPRDRGGVAQRRYHASQFGQA